MNRKVRTFIDMFTFIFVVIGIAIGVVHFLVWIKDQIPAWMYFWLIAGVVCNGIISLAIASNADSDKDNKSKSDDEKK